MQERADGHGLRSGGFQQVVDACRQLSQFLLPQQVEDVLRVFAEARILVEEPRLDVLAVRQLDLAWMVLAKPSGGEEHREAHDVEVLLSVVQGILPDTENFVLLQVRVARELVVQVADGVGLKAGHVGLIGLLQHGAAGVVGHFNDLFGRLVDRVGVNVLVEPVDFRQRCGGRLDEVYVDEATPDDVALGRLPIDYDVQLWTG